MYTAPRFFKSPGFRRTLTVGAWQIANDEEQKPTFFSGLPHHTPSISKPKLQHFRRQEIEDVTRVVFGPVKPVTTDEEQPGDALSSPISLHENKGVHAAIVKMASNLLEKPEVQDCLSEELSRWEMIDIPGGLSVPVLKGDSETMKLAACLKQASLLPPVCPPSSCVAISSEDSPKNGENKEVKNLLNTAGEGQIEGTATTSTAANEPIVDSKSVLSGANEPLHQHKEHKQQEQPVCGEAKPRRHKSKRSKKSKEKESPGLLTRVANWIKTTIFGALVPAENTSSKEGHKKQKKQEQKVDNNVAVDNDGIQMEYAEDEENNKSKAFPWGEAALGVALGVLVLLVFKRQDPAFFSKLVTALKR
jgi:hypothetical protein